jgi:glucokinase
MNVFIAIDIGGTHIRVAAYPSDSNTALDQRRIPTSAKTGTPVERLIGLIHDIIQPDFAVQAIGLAAPGFLEPQTGVVITAPNIPGWNNLALRDILVREFKIPVLLGNDANLAALGEWRYGAGQGFQYLLYLTISTGIGGGIITDGKLIEGWRGMAGEFGHVSVMPDGPLCGCGERGHLEAIASGPAIARWVSEQLELGVTSSLSPTPPPTAKEINAAAIQGDDLSIRAFQRSGLFFGRALASFIHLFNPQIVILGGGVTRSGPIWMDAVRASLDESIMSPEYLRGMTLTTAALGDDAGLFGALALARSFKT